MSRWLLFHDVASVQGEGDGGVVTIADCRCAHARRFFLCLFIHTFKTCLLIIKHVKK